MAGLSSTPGGPGTLRERKPPPSTILMVSPEGRRIDWILVTPGFRVRRVAIITANRDSRYPSDHFPYEAEVDY